MPKIGPGDKVGVVGLGGLGHMGVKLAAAIGAEVTIITTSPGKGEDARGLGASHVLLSTDRAAMKAATGSFDFVLDTIPVPHEIGPYLSLLRAGGELSVLGVIDRISLNTAHLISGGKRLSGSAIGGIAQTQELLDFCAEKHILSECETIAMSEINPLSNACRKLTSSIDS